tara:strand:- start:163 stop:456 length:294 start_codon:yes stop_codon:yes gene_type:complete
VLKQTELLILLIKEFNFQNVLVWLSLSETPTNHLKPLLEKKYVEYIGDCDFDQTMIAVAQELWKWPPKVIDNPTQQLLEELEEVKDYTVYVDKILMH